MYTYFIYVKKRALFQLVKNQKAMDNISILIERAGIFVCVIIYFVSVCIGEYERYVF